MLQLLKLFLPTWKFFDHVGMVPILYFRMGELESTFSDWEKVIEFPQRRLLNGLINPHGNWVSHQHTALHQILNDNLVYEPTELENTESFQFVKKLVEQKVIQARTEQKQIFYQFKLSGVSIQNLQFREEDLIVSPIYSSSDLWK